MSGVFSPHVSNVRVGQYLGVIENLTQAARPHQFTTEPVSIQYQEIKQTDLVTLSYCSRYSIHHLRSVHKKIWPHPRRVLRHPFENNMHHAILLDRIKLFKENISDPLKRHTSVYIFTKRFVFVVQGPPTVEVYAFTKHARRHTGVLQTFEQQVRFYHELKQGKLWIAHALG